MLDNLMECLQRNDEKEIRELLDDTGTHAVLIIFGIMLIDYSFARLFCTLERGNWSRE